MSLRPARLVKQSYFQRASRIFLWGLIPWVMGALTLGWRLDSTPGNDFLLILLMGWLMAGVAADALLAAFLAIPALPPSDRPFAFKTVTIFTGAFALLVWKLLV